MEIGIVAFLVLVVIFAAFASWHGWRHIDWGVFEKIFGFKPPSPEDGLDAIEKAQQKVDNKLHILAEGYAEADLYERKTAKPVFAAISSNAVKRAQGPLKAKAYKIRLARARGAIKRAKAKFWHAHRVAKAFGFRVHKRYTDYLSDELCRKVLGRPQPQRGGHGSA